MRRAEIERSLEVHRVSTHSQVPTLRNTVIQGTSYIKSMLTDCGDFWIAGAYYIYNCLQIFSYIYKFPITTYISCVSYYNFSTLLAFSCKALLIGRLFKFNLLVVICLFCEWSISPVWSCVGIGQELLTLLCL